MLLSETSCEKCRYICIAEGLFPAVFRIPDILRQIRVFGSVQWITNPDPDPAVFRIPDILRQIQTLGSVQWITNLDLDPDPDPDSAFFLQWHSRSQLKISFNTYLL